jgi:hypothetical protein
MNEKAFWRDAALYACNVLVCVSLGISSWALNAIGSLRTDLAETRAKMPAEYPPKWFRDDYQQDMSEIKSELTAIKKEVQLNHDAILLLRRP